MVDRPGHILERLATAWVRHGRGLEEAEIVRSSRTSVSSIFTAAERAGMLHWVQQHAFVRYGRMHRGPQTVMVHHVNPPALEETTRRLACADAVAASSLRWQSRLRQLTGRDVFLVPYSLDTSVFRPSAAAAARAALGIAPERYVIGFAAKAKSNDNRRKRIDLFSSIAVEAERRWGDITVLLAGEGWNDAAGDLRRDGMHVVRIVPGRTEEMASIYPAMNAFLCTSAEEGGPVTILEAMACAVPVVTTDVGHVPEVVRDGRNGFVAEAETAAFLERIAVLRESAGVAERMAAAGRESMEKERDDRVVVPRIDFKGIYGAARRRYAERSRLEILLRTSARLPLQLRLAARRALRR